MANIQDNKAPGNDGLAKEIDESIWNEAKKYLSTQYNHQNIKI